VHSRGRSPFVVSTDFEIRSGSTSHISWRCHVWNMWLSVVQISMSCMRCEWKMSITLL
jgi:hypothetical protein